MKIHLFGAPGSGVSTTGKALAETLGVPHFDIDDYHWFTNDALPYRRRRNPDHRRKLLTADLDAHESWVLSGALCGWGDVFIPRFDLVAWLWLPVELRLSRIREREIARYGADRVGAGGDLEVVFEKFLQWAAAYDENSGNIRSYDLEKQWLAQLKCPIIILDKDQAIGERVRLLT